MRKLVTKSYFTASYASSPEGRKGAAVKLTFIKESETDDELLPVRICPEMYLMTC